MEHESRHVEAQHDGERDRMMYEEKPSFKSYYKAQLYHSVGSKNTVICHETGNTYKHIKNRLYNMAEDILFLGVLALVVWSVITHSKISNDVVYIAEQTIKIALLFTIFIIIHKYIMPLRYYWIKFTIVEDMDEIDEIKKKVASNRSPVVRSIIRDGSSLMIVFLQLIVFREILGSDALITNVLPKVRVMMVFGVVVFLLAVIINVSLWKDTKHRQTDKSENMAEGNDE